MSEYRHPIEADKDREQAIGPAVPVRDNEQIPPGYSLFQRDVRLLNGRTEPAFYSTHVDQTPDPGAWERSSPSVLEGFIWALQTERFYNALENEYLDPEDDDRTQEIGNMISYGISQGLTENQVMECYERAYAVASGRAT